jgi:large subunit ribosomal protein L30
MTTVRVIQVRSAIGQSRAHERTLRALGLGRIGKSVEHRQTPELEGKLRHVAHLVSVAPTEAKGS